MPHEQIRLYLLRLVAKLYDEVPDGTIMDLDPMEIALISLADHTFNRDVGEDVATLLRDAQRSTFPTSESN